MTSMSRGAIYVAYRHGEKICEGNVHEVASMLRVNPADIWGSARNGVKSKGYRFKKMPKGYEPEELFHEGGLSDDGKRMLENMRRRYNYERFGEWEI